VNFLRREEVGWEEWGRGGMCRLERKETILLIYISKKKKKEEEEEEEEERKAGRGRDMIPSTLSTHI
jgi:hypothetical protein